ncbi:hypothetical protein ASPZODRAFT_55251 [Penicilliopsis zonata CBS 506.65]|uniref:Carboxypeptidase n=1 Tax=Penicilliopsis zonata CBS 506.65 TaxID=1073090 RepID=A0A1L9SWY7_9EURO|nr:hypothetical protein ASPZODRAFT_55251 [Penicilliopsis zonata CBS 506.65]OJJ51694.1 hypothetical protein ASPZODRAFT_55251 [Penicilliopsis zonata CBS 506.65]
MRGQAVVWALAWAIGLLPRILCIEDSKHQAALLQQPEGHSPDFIRYQHAEFPSHSIRIKEQSDDLCNAGSKQYTGWLDANGKHLFFWYFDSLNDPLTDPLTLWVTGGPGVSSLVGLLVEIGPCLIDDGGEGTHRNPFSWTRNSSMIFVDQPAGTGLSYTDPGTDLPTDSKIAAEDMYIFLQIFLTQVFPERREVPFHIAGESYGGHYVPNMAVEILKQNKIHQERPEVPLKSIMIGNGCVSPMHTTYGFYETLCTTKPGVETPVFNATRCKVMADALPRCMYVYESCYRYPDKAICKATEEPCGIIFDLFESESHAGGRDPFDITRVCEVEHLCYSSTLNVQEYINSKSVWSALDVPDAIHNFSIESPGIVAAFESSNDLYANTMNLIQSTLEHKVDVLIYNGNLDLACNTAGNLRWTNALRWNGQAEFESRDLRPWFSVVEGELTPVGQYKEVSASARGGDADAQRFAFVTVDKAGHMVSTLPTNFNLKCIHCPLLTDGVCRSLSVSRPLH